MLYINKRISDKIIWLLKFKEVKWTQKELSENLGVSKRTIRLHIEQINKTIDDDNVIILSGQNGFWITSDKKEVIKNIEHLKTRALKMLTRYYTTMKKNGFPKENLIKELEKIESLTKGE